MRPTVIWGGRGHAKVLAEFLPSLGYEIVAVFDNDFAVTSPLLDVPIFHGQAEFNAWIEAAESTGSRDSPATSTCGLVAIGGQHGVARLALLRMMRARGVNTPTVIHPTAFVALDAVIGVGCQVLAQSAVCADAVLGEGCIVNTAASVDHECVLSEGVHIGPKATLAGCVEVGSGAFIGAASVVLPRVRIGQGSIVGAGSVVTRDVPDRVIAYGNPARVMRRIEASAPAAA